MNRHVVTIITLLGLAIGPSALFTTSAFAGQSPDARDANISARDARSVPSVDLRSPDARDAARMVVPQTQRHARVDLRSPDTRDASSGVRYVTLNPTAAKSPGSSSFHWG